jgi:hypothetical protein
LPQVAELYNTYIETHILQSYTTYQILRGFVCGNFEIFKGFSKQHHKKCVSEGLYVADCSETLDKHEAQYKEPKYQKRRNSYVGISRYGWKSRENAENCQKMVRKVYLWPL